jgi:hypothetical protein
MYDGDRVEQSKRGRKQKQLKVLGKADKRGSGERRIPGTGTVSPESNRRLGLGNLC